MPSLFSPLVGIISFNILTNIYLYSRLVELIVDYNIYIVPTKIAYYRGVIKVL